MLTFHILIQVTYAPLKNMELIKTGIFYSSNASEPHTIPVRLYRPRTRHIIPEDYDTRRWVRDACSKMYKRTRGRATLPFESKEDEALELFFCPFQQISNDAAHDNFKNPHLSSLIDLEDAWYGNLVILKTVRGNVVDLRPNPDEMNIIRKMVKR